MSLLRLLHGLGHLPITLRSSAGIALHLSGILHRRHLAVALGGSIALHVLLVCLTIGDLAAQRRIRFGIPCLSIAVVRVLLQRRLAIHALVRVSIHLGWVHIALPHLSRISVLLSIDLLGRGHGCPVALRVLTPGRISLRVQRGIYRIPVAERLTVRVVSHVVRHV